MLLIDLLLLPLKLVIKLVLYSIGGIIAFILMTLNTIVSLLSGFLFIAGIITVGAALLAIITMFGTIGFSTPLLISSVILIVAVGIAITASNLIPEVIKFIMGIPSFIFMLASFRLFTRKRTKRI